MAKYNEIKNINDYIKREHPMYFRELIVDKRNSSVQLMSLINEIYHVLKSTSPDGEVVIDGKVYQQIDKLFNNYVNSNFSEEERKEIDDKFNSFCDYVKVVIKEVGNLDDEQYLDKISWYVAGLIVQKFDYKKRPFFNSKNIIIDCYKMMDKSIKNYQRIDEIISSSVEASKKKIGFDKKTLDKIYCDISVEMYKRNIDGDNVNKFVEEKFIKESKVMLDNVIRRVKKVISLMDAPFTINDDKVVFEISFEATMSGEISAVDLIDGKLDEYVIKKAENYRLKKIPNYKVIQHVFRILRSEVRNDILDSELRDYSQQVVNRLKKENGYNSKNIVLGEADELIKKMYLEKFHKSDVTRVQMMREQSVKQAITKNYKPVDYVKRNRIIKKIKQELAKFLIASVIGGALGVSAGVYVNKREDDLAVSIVQSIDETDYRVNKRDSRSQQKSYENIVDGVINYYNDLKLYGDEYTSLSFYNAYKSGLSIIDMDRVFRNVRHDLSLSNEYESYNDLDCYYGYIYDVLLDAGYVELSDQKYTSAILSYMQSYYGNLYGIPSDFHLHREDRLALEHMTQLYEEYSKKMQIELGNKIKNIETEEQISLKSGGNRR